MSQVLIVEDQEPMRRLLRAWVEAEGASVIEAETAEEGLRLAHAEDTAVALCDIRLPGHDGLWLADQLRAVAPHTSVVMATGLHEFDTAVRSLQTGAVDYLAKPFTRDRLVEALHRGFAAHTARRAVAVMRDEMETDRTRMTEALADAEVTTASSVEAMLSIMETRRPGTREAAGRVARTAVNLALALDVREPDLSSVERAALLRELGPVLIEAAPGPPNTLNDRALVRRALVQAQTILEGIPFLAPATQLLIASFERFDGAGLPQGLRGDAIPLGARIVSVAAAFEAARHESPCRPALAAVAALEADRPGELDLSVVLTLRALYQPSDLASSGADRIPLHVSV